MTKNKQAAALVIAYLGFISLGLPDTVLGVAWPQMRREFGAPMFWAGVLARLTTAVSAAASLAAGRLAAKRFQRRTAPMGPGKILTACTFTTALAMLGYGLAPGIAAVALFTLFFGIGQGAVDTVLNAHMARHYSAGQMNRAHGCWGLGATLGPLIFTAAFSLNLGWRSGYLFIFTLQLLLGLTFLKTLGLWQLPPPKEKNQQNEISKPRRGNAPPQINGDSTIAAGNGLDSPITFNPIAAWQPRRAGAGVVFYFFYSGVEMVGGLWAASYLVDHLGAAPFNAGAAASLYWASLTVGRFALGCAADRLGNTALIRGSLALTAAGLAVLIFTSSAALFSAALILVGFGLAPLYPTMMHETPQRSGPERTDQIIGFQVGAALAGTAVLPALAGLVISRAGLPWLPKLMAGSALILIICHEISAGKILPGGRR